jgi:hypothetical protein
MITFFVKTGVFPAFCSTYSILKRVLLLPCQCNAPSILWKSQTSYEGIVERNQVWHITIPNYPWIFVNIWAYPGIDIQFINFKDMDISKDDITCIIKTHNLPQNYNFKLCLEGSQPLFFTCLNFQLDATVECRVNRLSGTPSKSRHDKPSILYSLPNPLILNTVYPTPYYGCIVLFRYVFRSKFWAVIPWLLPSRYRNLLFWKTGRLRFSRLMNHESN